MSERRPNDIEAFTSALPDPQGARAFLSRLESLPSFHSIERNRLLLSRLLTLAAHAPFLAESLLRHPEHIEWLQRETERDFDRVKSTEQLSQDLARFNTRMIDADQPSRLARFKRREMLRIYLRDCLGVATLAEVTEELSNLADVILGYALALAQQEMINLHGTPSTRDERGRIAQSEFAIVALGKLGCRELNYASDIDLLFLYSGAGDTSGSGRLRESVISNKEFFTAVANSVVRMIGSNSGEGAVYRIDLRLRPYGRDGDIVWDVERAADYYRGKAQNWERQALIRARASAGSEAIVARFMDSVRGVVFAADALPDTIAEVRRAKEKIDRKIAQAPGGFNVKLGRGGIREIEFIAQALQLEYGGREPWVRSAQTLIVLARLAEKGYLTEPERTRLSAAYTFLRTVEHRLQMEHGAQTHTLPVARERLAMVARRCGYLSAADPAAAFTSDLEAHTAAVRAVYNRVFLESDPRPASTEQASATTTEIDDESGRLINTAARSITKLIAAHRDAAAEEGLSLPHETERVAEAIARALACAVNPLRSLRNLIAWAESLSTYGPEVVQANLWFSPDGDGGRFIRRMLSTLSSQYLSHMLISRPQLAAVLAAQGEGREMRAEFFSRLCAAVDREEAVAAKTDALRRAWYRIVIGIGCRDMAAGSEEGHAGFLDSDSDESSNPLRPAPPTSDRLPPADLKESNLDQTALAEAALRVAAEIALGSIGVSGVSAEQLPFAILGLGRLGHSGMDYGSDLDLLVVFDDESRWPPPALDAIAPRGSAQEFYAKLTAQLVRVLSSITREGLLYRMDLRLRPDGQSGPLAQGISGLVAYLTERASAWEHSAYLKVREVAGDLTFGARAREAICEAVFTSAARNLSLKEELRSMRARLEKEKARRGRPNIKWGAGGMTDVYFITRYLQLRDRISFPTERGTTALITHLGERGSLDPASTEAIYEGYSFLRKLDHWMRLLLDRPGPALPDTQIGLRDITRAMGIASVEQIEQLYAAHTARIREVYNLVFE